MGRHLTGRDLAKIEALYAEGKSPAEIASILPYSKAVIRKHIRNAGLEPFPVGARVRHSEHYFKTYGGAMNRDRVGTVVPKAGRDADTARSVLWDGRDEPSPWHINFLEAVEAIDQQQEGGK